MQKRSVFVSRRTKIAAAIITLVLPVLLLAYAWFMNHRPALHIKSEWTFRDTLIQNSDVMLAFFFLVLMAQAGANCFLPERGPVVKEAQGAGQVALG